MIPYVISETVLDVVGILGVLVTESAWALSEALKARR